MFQTPRTILFTDNKNKQQDLNTGDSFPFIVLKGIATGIKKWQ